MTTEEIDAYVHQLYIERDCYPSPLNYNGYPKSVCTSVNEVICHGIPDSRPLQDGDIVNLDVTAYHGGVHGDTNATFFVGDVDPQSRQLVQGHRGGDVAGHRGGQARSAAQRHRQGDRDTRQEVPLWRHPGIRRPRHRRAVPRRHPGAPLLRRAELADDAPGDDVHHRADDQHRVVALSACDDDWTAVTADGKRTAQFEHTILVTDDGFEVLTGGDGAVSPAAPWHR